MDDLCAELADGASRVNVLPDKVRRVEIEAQVRARDGLEHRRPQGRRRGEVGAARPFIQCEQHGAVFDAERDAFPLRVLDDVRPDRQEQGPVASNGFGGIAAHESVDDADTDTRSRADDLFQVLDHAAAMVRIGMERIGIIAEPGDRHAGPIYQLQHARRLIVIDLGYVQMTDPGVAPIGFARRPAHQLNAGEPFVGGEGHDFFE